MIKKKQNKKITTIENLYRTHVSPVSITHQKNIHTLNYYKKKKQKKNRKINKKTTENKNKKTKKRNMLSQFNT